MTSKSALLARGSSSALCAICSDRLADQSQESGREPAVLQDDVRFGLVGNAPHDTNLAGSLNDNPHGVMAIDSDNECINGHLKEHMTMLASISHDLQTPITRMRLRVEVMDKCIEKEKIVNDLLEMEHLVRQTVSYVRSTLGGAKARVKIDSVAFLETLVFDYQDMCRPVTLSAPSSDYVRTCPQTLRRVLGNLIDNAIKYAGAAEICAQRNAGGALSITVSDRGPGIPENELKQVLRPFYRSAASPHCGSGGVGLGLAIVAQLIRSLEGGLVLSNRDGGGLAATVTLP